MITLCRPIQSVIILVIKQIGLPLRGRPILLITRMISLNFIRLLRVVITPSVREEKTTRSNRMNFRLSYDYRPNWTPLIPITITNFFAVFARYFLKTREHETTIFFFFVVPQNSTSEKIANH